MPHRRPPHLHKEITRHGKAVWYVRIGKGPRVRIDEPYGSRAFTEAYDAAIAGKAKRPGKAAEGTLRWLLERYRKSGAWTGLSLATQHQRSNIFRGVLETAGDAAFTDITRKAIIDGRERRESTPSQARHFVVAMRGLFRWAVAAEHCTKDPTEGVASPRPKTEGHHTWTLEECEAYEKKWPVGTRERLAYDVLLYTGLRRGDAAVLGRQHVKRGIVTIRTEKTGELVIIPLLSPLVKSIEASPTGDLTYITTAKGKPYTKDSFGNWFRRQCEEAGVPGSAHGLRKAGATRAADNGATEAELEALFGWRGGRMASVYTRKANRGRLALKAAIKLLPDPEMPPPHKETPWADDQPEPPRQT